LPSNSFWPSRLVRRCGHWSASLHERHYEVCGAQDKSGIRSLSIDSIFRYSAIWNIGFAIQGQYLRFVQAFEQVSKTVDDDLMGHDQCAILDMIATQDLDDAADTQDYVAPAFATRRSEVELAHLRALRGKSGKFAQDAVSCVPIQNAELLLAKTLVRVDFVVIETKRRCHCSARLSRTHKR